MKEKRSSGLLASTVNPAPNIQGKLWRRNSTPFWWLAAGGNRPFNLPRSDISWAEKKRKVNWSGIDGRIGRNPDGPVYSTTSCEEHHGGDCSGNTCLFQCRCKAKLNAATVFLFPLTTNGIDCTSTEYARSYRSLLLFPYLGTNVIGNNSLTSSMQRRLNRTRIAMV